VEPQSLDKPYLSKRILAENSKSLRKEKEASLAKQPGLGGPSLHPSLRHSCHALQTIKPQAYESLCGPFKGKGSFNYIKWLVSKDK